MSNKNKTISFRVSEEKFETLREVAEELDLSLSAVFRDYVDMLVDHNGKVEVVPEHEVNGEESDDDSFPPTVEVPKAFIREHERLELEADHLREQLDEYKRYVTMLREEVEGDDDEDVILLDELDGELEDETQSPYRISEFDEP
mgnify:CR=1 FL=1